MRAQTTKLLEENTGKPYDLGLGSGSSDMTSEAQARNKLDIIKVKNCFKGHQQEREKTTE